jgi:putative tricarboxylic transport membrane protein
MKLNDAVFGLLLMLLGAAVLFAIQGYPKIPGQPVGPALFPGLIAAGLCICGVLLVVRGWRQRARTALAGLGRLGALAAPRLALAVLLGSIRVLHPRGGKLGFLPDGHHLILLALFLVLRVPPGRAVLIA